MSSANYLLRVPATAIPGMATSFTAFVWIWGANVGPSSHRRSRWPVPGGEAEELALYRDDRSALGGSDGPLGAALFGRHRVAPEFMDSPAIYAPDGDLTGPPAEVFFGEPPSYLRPDETAATAAALDTLDVGGATRGGPDPASLSHTVERVAQFYRRAAGAGQGVFMFAH